MAYIDKLLNKFNKVKNAVNSIKGIQSKIQSINYTSAIDALQIDAKAAEDLIDARRSSLEDALGAKAGALFQSKKRPAGYAEPIVYPMYDQLENYLVFDIRPRRARGAFNDHAVHKHRSVALYVPDALISQASVQYRAEGISTFQRSINSMLNSIGDIGSGGGANMMEEGKKMGTKFLKETMNTMTGGLSNLKAGRASNPLQEQMLDGVPFRSWDFTFDFWPKSQAEANRCNEILYTFRSSMLPDAYSENFDVDSIDGDGKWTPAQKEVVKNSDINASYFNYPNVFEIFFEGPIGDKIDGFLPAVCTNAQIDYTGGQKFSTFEDGQPVHMQLTLNFLEIKVMTLGNYEQISSKEFRGTAPDQDSLFNRASQTGADIPDDTIDTGG
jgi:hypothetical protein